MPGAGGNAKLLKLAEQTVALAVKAPGRDGAFKCIAVPMEGGKATLWAAGDGSGGSTKDGFLGYDMSWTGYWLLKWRAAQLPGSEDILPRCQRTGPVPDRPSGGRRHAAHKVRRGRFRPGRAVAHGQGGNRPGGPLPLELYAQDRDPAFLDAARHGMDFLERQVIPLRQWYDYETFWSCSPRTPRFDERTEQWPANNLALGQTVAAYLAAFRLTGEARYLATGESPAGLPAARSAVLDQSRDRELVRQRHAARRLHDAELRCGVVRCPPKPVREHPSRLLSRHGQGRVPGAGRGRAAAQFPISPSENWAHQGYGGKAGVSSFHWGTGSGMAGIEIEEDYLRDAVVDVSAGWGVGVNGLNVVRCAIHGSQIRLEIRTPLAWTVSRWSFFAGRSRAALPGPSQRGRGRQLERGRSGERDSAVAGKQPMSSGSISHQRRGSHQAGMHQTKDLVIDWLIGAEIIRVDDQYHASSSKYRMLTLFLKVSV